MSVYNEDSEWIEESINSILKQTYTNIEFIIVFDNPDNKLLLKICREFSKSDNRILLIENNINLGLIKSLNKAIKISSGKYIARMDADDISYKERIFKQLVYLEDNNLDLIGSNVKLFRTNNLPFFVSDKLLTHDFLEKKFFYGAIGIVHPTFFGRKEVFEHLKGYSNSLYTEDKEFLARVFVSKFKVGNIKDVLLDYRYNDKSITKTKAIYIHTIGKYITKCYRDFLKSGNYFFDESFDQKLFFNQSQIDSFNRKQILLGEMRKELDSKNYIKFLFKFFKALYLSKTIILDFKINILFRILKFKENQILKKND
jgi:glycosyltransferase involved in cell wall biosynthesis